VRFNVALSVLVIVLIGRLDDLLQDLRRPVSKRPRRVDAAKIAVLQLGPALRRLNDYKRVRKVLGEDGLHPLKGFPLLSVHAFEYTAVRVLFSET